MHLLLVTHQSADVAVLQKYVAEVKHHWTLTTAVSLHQAQTLLTQTQPTPYDIILTEAELPDGLGQELLSLAGQVPLILLTQPGTETAVGQALAAGATAHLIKDAQQAYLTLLPPLLEHTAKCNQQLIPTLDNHILQQALHNSVIPLVVADAQQANSPIIYVNTAFESLTGYQASDSIGRTCLFLAGDDHDQSGLATLRTALATGQTRSARVRNYRQDGRLFWNDMTLLDIRNEAGELTHFLAIQRDVTSQQEMQAQLVANEQRVRDVLTSLPDLVFRVRGDGTFLDYYTSETELLLVPPSQFIGQTIGKILPSDLAQQGSQYIAQTLWSGQSSRFEYSLTVGTEPEYFEARILPYAVDEVLVVIREVTAERRAWARVQESEQLYRQMFEMHGLPKLIVDPETGQIVDANVAATDFYGVEMARLCSSFLFDWTDLSPTTVLNTLKEAVSRNVLWWRSRHQTHGRGQRDVEIFSGPVNIGGNHLLYLILTDITTRVKAQHALKEAFDSLEDKVLERTAALTRSEQQYRSLFNQSNDAVFLLDTDGKHLQVNQRAADMLGYTKEELIGLSIEQVVVPGEYAESQQILTRLLAGEKIPLYNRLFHHKRGRYIPVEVNVELVQDEEGQPLHIQSIVRDITARKVQERQLRYHASLQQAVTDAVIALDSQNRVQSWNSAAEKLYGYTAVEAVGQDVTQLLQTMYPPETLLEKNISSTVSVGVGEIIQRDKQGHVLYILSSVSPLYDEFGQREGVVAINRDITERKRAELALREREEQYRVTIETISEGIVQQDHQGRIQLCNAAANRILGLSVEQLMGRSSLDPRWQAIQEDGTPFPGEMHPAMVTLRTGESQDGVIMGVHKPDGQLTWISINSEPIFDPEGGRVTAVVTTFTDITTQRQMIENLRQSEHRLELAAEAGGIGVWDWDAQQDILLWDKRMHTLYGLPYDETGAKNHPYRYKDWVKTIHPDDRAQTEAAIRTAIRGEEPYNREFRIIRPDGTVRYLTGLGIVFQQADGKPLRMVGINQDITTRKQVEQTLYSALEKERELNELKSRFVSMASHEFRTPLAAILAMTETLTLFRDRLESAQMDDRLNKIRYQVHHLETIVDDVLQLERIQTGRLKMQPALHDFDQLCRKIIAEFESQPAYQGRLNYHFAAEQAQLMAFFDEQLMRQVINNLVHNGLKYSPADQPVYINLQTTDTTLTLTVQDRGIGIPPKDLARLFEPFHRAQNVGVIPGTGLGLSIAKKAVDLHRGSLTVTTELNQGTTLYLTLPLSKTEEHIQDDKDIDN